MEPDLNELMKKEKEAFRQLGDAFISYTIAHNDVQNRLREIREQDPTPFTHDKDN